MHIVLAALASIVTILILLNRLADAGIDLGGLNPFLWRRRRSWRNKLEGNPIFSVREPLDLAALLVVGVAKIDGDVSAQEKQAVLKEFETTFQLKPSDASELFRSSAHLLGDAKVLLTHLDRVLAEGGDQFTPDQVHSAIAMMERIANVAGEPSEEQRQLIETVRAHLSPAPSTRGIWS